MSQAEPLQKTGTTLEPPPTTVAPIPAVYAVFELLTAARVPAKAVEAVGKVPTVYSLNWAESRAGSE